MSTLTLTTATARKRTAQRTSRQNRPFSARSVRNDAYVSYDSTNAGQTSAHHRRPGHAGTTGAPTAQGAAAAAL